MIYLKLFLVFLEIGAVSFGGGYGMLSLMRELTLANGWLTEKQLLNFVAVSESTPGPIAINMATFIGSSQGGLFGAFCATLGVVLPAFVIMLLIVSLTKNLIKSPVVRGILSGVRPCVVGLIIATAVIMGISTMFGFTVIGDRVTVNLIGIGIFAGIAALGFGYKKLTGKRISPILLIIISAVLGGVLFAL